MGEPAPSEKDAATPDGASAGTPATSPSTSRSNSAKVDGTTFTNTKQHVASRRTGEGETERFANTRLNIALINDPKNGPRFTLTKREADRENKTGDDAATEAGKKAEDEQPATDKAAPDQHAEPTPAPNSAAPSETRSETPAADRSNENAVATADAAPATPGEERASAAARAPAPSGMPPAAEPPSKVQIDSSKAFIGPNGTYYDESWRWMDWRGTRQSWNWPAALTFGHWFAYRRLYSLAALHQLWLTGLAAAAVNNVPIVALVVLALITVGLTGIYGNILYFHAFRRAVDHVTKTGEGSYQELMGQLARAGGTSPLSLGVMGLLSLAGVIGALGATLYLRGEFVFNVWPFS